MDEKAVGTYKNLLYDLILLFVVFNKKTLNSLYSKKLFFYEKRVFYYVSAERLLNMNGDVLVNGKASVVGETPHDIHTGFTKNSPCNPQIVSWDRWC